MANAVLGQLPFEVGQVRPSTVVDLADLVGEEFAGPKGGGFRLVTAAGAIVVANRGKHVSYTAEAAYTVDIGGADDRPAGIVSQEQVDAAIGDFLLIQVSGRAITADAVTPGAVVETDAAGVVGDSALLGGEAAVIGHAVAANLVEIHGVLARA